MNKKDSDEEIVALAELKRFNNTEDRGSVKRLC